MTGETVHNRTKLLTLLAGDTVGEGTLLHLEVVGLELLLGLLLHALAKSLGGDLHVLNVGEAGDAPSRGARHIAKLKKSSSLSKDLYPQSQIHATQVMQDSIAW